MAKQGFGKQCERPESEQGDVNTTPARQRYWERNLSGEARNWFEEDARYFLHQSLSTPVLNVIARARPGVDVQHRPFHLVVSDFSGIVNQSYEDPGFVDR